MSQELRPIKARLDSRETAVLPALVAEALADAVGAARDLQRAGLVDCAHKALGMTIEDCVRCNLNSSIDHLDEVMNLWKRGELFTVRTPDEGDQ